MISAFRKKYGVCGECENGKDVLLYRSSPKECRFHYQKNKRDKYYQKKKERDLNKPKKAVKIKSVSTKKLKELSEYRVKRDSFMKINIYCQVKGCGKGSTNLHHKAGRNGSLLTNVKYFMACCSDCHPRRIHFEQDYEGWSRENGYILTVNTK